MSYLHCPVCSRAFNLAQHPACPHCPVAAAPVDPVAELVAAAESLARALAQATPEQRAAAAGRVSLPAASTPSAATTALQPVPGALPAPRRSRWLGSIAVTAIVTATVTATVTTAVAAAVAAIDRLAPHAPRRLLRAVHAGVKAFAA